MPEYPFPQHFSVVKTFQSEGSCLILDPVFEHELFLMKHFTWRGSQQKRISSRRDKLI